MRAGRVCLVTQLGLTLCDPTDYNLGFPGGSVVKEFTWKAGDLGSIPELGDPLEEGLATHLNILAWRIPMYRGAW